MTRHASLILSLAIMQAYPSLAMLADTSPTTTQTSTVKSPFSQRIDLARTCCNTFNSHQQAFRACFSPNNSIMNSFFTQRDARLQTIYDELNKAELLDQTNQNDAIQIMAHIDSLITEYKKTNDTLQGIITSI